MEMSEGAEAEDTSMLSEADQVPISPDSPPTPPTHPHCAAQPAPQ